MAVICKKCGLPDDLCECGELDKEDNKIKKIPLLNKLSLNKVLSVVDDMLVVIIILVTTFSFFIGVFLVFFTNIGDVVKWHSDVPLDFLILGLFGLSSINFNLGISFLLFLTVYLACFLFCFFKPIP